MLSSASPRTRSPRLLLSRSPLCSAPPIVTHCSLAPSRATDSAVSDSLQPLLCSLLFLALQLPAAFAPRSSSRLCSSRPACCLFKFLCSAMRVLCTAVHAQTHRDRRRSRSRFAPEIRSFESLDPLSRPSAQKGDCPSVGTRRFHRRRHAPNRAAALATGG